MTMTTVFEENASESANGMMHSQHSHAAERRGRHTFDGESVGQNRYANR